ncbi:MAG: hypothetical protein ABSG81_02650 [Acidimicrobiales bacterium]
MVRVIADITWTASNCGSGCSYVVSSLISNAADPVLNLTPAAPTVITGSATHSTTTATVNGTVDTNSGLAADSMYFCFSTNSSSVTSGSCGVSLTAANPGSADSSSQAETLNLTSLVPGTEYYYNLVAETSAGAYYYGTPASFSTNVAPTVTTGTAARSTTTATGNGSVNPEGDSDTVQFCYSSTSSQVTTSSCTGSLVTTTYYYDLVVISSGGTAYYGSPVQSFTTYKAPVLTMSGATNVSTTTATGNGSVNPEGDSDTVQFCYSSTSSQVTTSSCTGSLVTRPPTAPAPPTAQYSTSPPCPRSPVPPTARRPASPPRGPPSTAR